MTLLLSMLVCASSFAQKQKAPAAMKPTHAFARLKTLTRPRGRIRVILRTPDETVSELRYQDVRFQSQLVRTQRIVSGRDLSLPEAWTRLLAGQPVTAEVIRFFDVLNSFEAVAPSETLHSVPQMADWVGRHDGDLRE